MYIDSSGARKSKYNKKVLKYKVDVESESEDYEHDEEKERHESSTAVTLLHVCLHVSYTITRHVCFR